MIAVCIALAVTAALCIRPAIEHDKNLPMSVTGKGPQMNNDQPSNNQFASALTFGKQHVLNHAPRDLEAEARALRYLDKHAPDLVGVILGGVL